MSRLSPHARRLLPWVLGVFIASGVLAAVRKPGELPVYMRAAERAVAGESFYSAQDRPAFSYPPAFSLATVPLVPFSDYGRRWVWWALNLVLAGGVVFAVWRLARPSLRGDDEEHTRRRAWWWGGLTALLSARFLFSPLEYQSHDLILLALLTAAAVWWTRRDDGRAGVAAGLAAACKATPLLVLPFFLLRRRWVASAAMVAALAGATLLPDLLFPNPAGGTWAETWYGRFVARVSVGSAPDVGGAWRTWDPLNQSLTGTLARLTHDPPSENYRDVAAFTPPAGVVKGLTLAAQAAVLLWLVWCGWRRPKNDRPRDPFAAGVDDVGPHRPLTPGLRCLAELGLALCGMLLLSPMSSTQHFCFLLPAAAVIAARAVRAPSDRVNLAAAAALFLLGTLPARDLIGDGVYEFVRTAGGHTACAIVALLGAGRLLVADRRAAAAPAVVREERAPLRRAA